VSGGGERRRASGGEAPVLTLKAPRHDLLSGSSTSFYRRRRRSDARPLSISLPNIMKQGCVFGQKRALRTLMLECLDLRNR